MDCLPIDPGAVRWSVPPTELPTALAERTLIVLMHGYGADEHDLVEIAPAFTSPQLSQPPLVASLRAPLQAGGGYSWFPIVDVMAAAEPDVTNVAVSCAGVLHWLEDAQAMARTNGPVVLAGFSQGGTMVTHLMRLHPKRFQCGIVLSGATVPGLIGGDEPLAQIRPPVFFGYGTADPIIAINATKRTAAFLSAHTDLTERAYPGLGHSVCTEELADIATFCSRRLVP